MGQSEVRIIGYSYQHVTVLLSNPQHRGQLEKVTQRERFLIWDGFLANYANSANIYQTTGSSSCSRSI